MASPIPTKTRATMPSANDPANANPSWRDGHQGDAGDQQPLGAEPVEERPDRDLHRRRRRTAGPSVNVASCGRADVEALGGDEAGDAEGGAVEDREHVDRDGRRPDRPGPATAERVDEGGVAGAPVRGRGGAHRRHPRHVAGDVEVGPGEGEELRLVLAAERRQQLLRGRPPRRPSGAGTCASRRWRCTAAARAAPGRSGSAARCRPRRRPARGRRGRPW